MLVDSLGEYEDMPVWTEAADVLLGAGLTLNPSELHGAVVGLLATGFKSPAEEQQDAAIAILEKALAVDLHGDAADFARRTLAATLSAVKDADFAFHPLLPDDDEPFDHRLLSMGRWASGFLTGYTQAVSAAESAGNPVDPETAEVLKDLAAIAQIDTSEDESEDAEREFEELVEYVRIAALNVVQDTFDNAD